MRHFWMVLALFWSGSALAGEKVLRRHSVQVGLGYQYAFAGLSYLYRFDDVYSAGAGWGIAGYTAHGRYSPLEGYRPLFLQLGFAPLLATHTDNLVRYTWYGPEAAVGVDTKYKGFSFTGSLGYGHAIFGVGASNISKPIGTITLGVGANFGKVD